MIQSETLSCILDRQTIREYRREQITDDMLEGGLHRHHEPGQTAGAFE